MTVGVVSTQRVAISTHSALELGRQAAERGLDAAQRFIADQANAAEVECALRIRAVENALYDLFGKGKLHGTIHTCIGQEFSGALLSKVLAKDDFVTSNHRCHGHFIAATGNWRGLIDEIVGNEDGVCAGIGSSQHLWARNFISNGQQGGLLPVAAGVALDRTTKGSAGVVVSFMGEGTLGEGVLYETLNIDGLWNLPHVVICENNFYSQSTPQDRSVSGQIGARAAGFGIEVAYADTWDLPSFDATLADCIERARTNSAPTFLTLTTYRLNPHSKGDDSRDRSEIEWFRSRDPATLAVRDHRHFRETYDDYVAEAAEHIELALTKPGLRAERYFVDQLPRAEGPASWARVPQPPVDEPRMAQQLNVFYRAWLERDETAFFIGEDIADPYGGAFKVAKGLTTEFAPRARTTPISEAAITGIGIGLAITGRRAFVEMMFGDFTTYAFDQIINNASKFFHIYNQNLECPVIIRTPMGGRRGYGPTHSQSLERFLVGVDNCCTISLNSLTSVAQQIAGLRTLRCPIILLENKSDYAAKTFTAPEGFAVDVDGALLPTVRIGPTNAQSTVTLLSYGGMARFVANALIEIFERTDVVPELIAPIGISPLNLEPIADSVRRTGRLVIVEEGAGFGSIGAELIAQLHERADLTFLVARVSGKAFPVPSAPALEAAALPSVDEVCGAISLLDGRRA
ncbi:MAG: thiamine pyrophosphate-dependent enzyme [Rhodopila sp.]|jgi:2-oxoisovalerate dehydrogenase E1 component